MICVSAVHRPARRLTKRVQTYQSPAVSVWRPKWPDDLVRITGLTTLGSSTFASARLLDAIFARGSLLTYCFFNALWPIVASIHSQIYRWCK